MRVYRTVSSSSEGRALGKIIEGALAQKRMETLLVVVVNDRFAKSGSSLRGMGRGEREFIDRVNLVEDDEDKDTTAPTTTATTNEHAEGGGGIAKAAPMTDDSSPPPGPCSGEGG